MSSSNENVTYALLEVVALLCAAAFAPLLAAFYGIVGQQTADGISGPASILLALPGSFVALAAVGYSLGCFVNGPKRARLRLATWYVLGPALFTVAAVFDPEAANAPAPLFDAGMVAALGFACVLPVVWLWKNRAT